MATLSEGRTTIVYEEPATKPPPLLVVGPLAWIRQNLFHSWLDTVLTILSGLLIVGVITSFITWSVGEANWFAVTFNLRQFMVGRYPGWAEWRVQLAVLLIVFVASFSLTTWNRVSRSIVIGLIVLLALALITPVVIDALIPLPPSYLVAGNVGIQSGSEKTQPQSRLAFIARAGETISIRYAADFAASDERLAELYSFADEAANNLLNAAATRLRNAARIQELEGQLAGDLLTAGQRERLNIELNKLEVPPPVTETYALNQSPVDIRVLRGTTLEPLVEGTLEADSPALTVTLPEDGWYVLEKTAPKKSKGNVLLQVEGMYPLLVRNFVRGEEVDEAGQVTQAAGRVQEYIRMTDDFETGEVRPVVDGKDVPIAVVIDQQYRGERSLSDYLRLHFSPLLRQLSAPVWGTVDSPLLSQIRPPFWLVVVLVVALGYASSRLVDRYFSKPEKRASLRAATWLLIATPVLIFVFVYGVGDVIPLTEPRRWGGLLLSLILTMVGILASFPLGVLLALGRRSELPAVRIVSTLYIELVRGVPLITVLFMAGLLVPLINPALAEIDNVFRAMVGITLFSAAYLAENVRGGLQAVQHGQEEAAKALGLNRVQIILHIILPQALRMVIPALVGQFKSLFMDTSLVAIVGLTDLTGISKTVTAQPEYIGSRREVLLFITILYFVFSYVITAVSRRIEASGAGAATAQRI